MHTAIAIVYIQSGIGEDEHKTTAAWHGKFLIVYCKFHF